MVVTIPAAYSRGPAVRGGTRGNQRPRRPGASRRRRAT